MSEHGDTDREYAMGYECPRCGTVGGHNRTHFGPQGDGRNLERYCRECGKKFLKTDAEHVVKDDRLREEEGGESSSSDTYGERSVNERETAPAKKPKSGGEPPKTPEPDGWLLIREEMNSEMAVTELDDNLASKWEKERMFSAATINDTIKEEIRRHERLMKSAADENLNHEAALEDGAIQALENLLGVFSER